MIELDILEQSQADQRALEKGYLFKDIKFDTEFSKFVGRELYSTAQPKDLAELQDAQAVYNSVKNIMTTAPGEKLLNPTFGLDLRTYLFEPINSTTSYFMASDIYRNLGVFEPRIVLNAVSVTGNTGENEYLIDIIFSIPTLDIYDLNLKATLNRDGYVTI